MGFFDKIKQGLNIGGVHVQLQAPNTADLNAASIACSVTLTTKSPQTVKSVKVGLYSIEIERSGATSQSDKTSRSTYPEDISVVTVASEPFVIQPTETKTFEVVIPLHPEQQTDVVEGMLAKVDSVLNKLNQNSKQYYIQARADVEGVALDPTDRQDLNNNGFHISIGG